MPAYLSGSLGHSAVLGSIEEALRDSVGKEELVSAVESIEDNSSSTDEAIFGMGCHGLSNESVKVILLVEG
jgi:hypothetical protein